MIRFLPYQRFSKALEEEALEPVFLWGLRMALAATVPILWGVANNKLELATWITLAAECLCWIELKGTYTERLRLLFFGTFTAMAFAILGSVTGGDTLLSVLAMVVVGFIAGVFKNLGNRASGLSICIYLLFIISNAYPTTTLKELEARTFLIAIGGFWNLIIALSATLLIPTRQPYRRTIALIMKANAAFIREVAKGWDEKSLRSNLRQLYLREIEVRNAINDSFLDYEKRADQVAKGDTQDYELTQPRKAASIIAINIQAIGEELEPFKVKDIPADLRYKLNATLKSMGNVMERLSIFLVLLTREEETLLNSRLSRLIKHLTLLREYHLEENSSLYSPFKRVQQLIERTLALLENAVSRIQKMEDDVPVFKSYSLTKTLVILHPLFWTRHIRLVFSPGTFTARYALRSALAAALAMFVYKWLRIDHGYWLPFTVIIVLQPYFGATFKKAVERVIGTVSGGIAGGLIIRLNAGVSLRELMLFISFIGMVYFMRKSYAIAAFFITLSLVLLFDVGDRFNGALIVTRALATVAGASIAIIAGFALLPTWDRKWLHIHLTKAIDCNYSYFIATFFSENKEGWTKNKRNAETRNSNAFDSFNRYMQEPAIKKRAHTPFYQIITHNVRITRELNNINLEQESNNSKERASEDQQKIINECLEWLNKTISLMKMLNPKITTDIYQPEPGFQSAFCLSTYQKVYLDKMLYEVRALYQDLAELLQFLHLVPEASSQKDYSGLPNKNR